MKLIRFLSSVSSKWYEISDQLGVDNNTLDGLITTSLSNEVKLSITLQRWLNNQPTYTPTTWRNIFNNIEEKHLQNKPVATEIQQYLLQGGIILFSGIILLHNPHLIL